MAKQTKEKETPQTPPATTQPEPQQTGIIATKAPPRKPIDPGNYFARCYMMILIGTIEEEYQGNKKTATKVRISWELPTELRVFKEGEEEKPCAISEEFTLSTSPKANLRHVIDSWRGKALTEKEAEAFDISKLLGKGCMLNIIHKEGTGKNVGKIYEKITGVASVPKGMAVPEPINEPRMFNYGDKFDAAFVKSLPDFIKKKIMSSAEWKAKVEADPGIVATAANSPDQQETINTGNEISDEDLPF